MDGAALLAALKGAGGNDQQQRGPPPGFGGPGAGGGVGGGGGGGAPPLVGGAPQQQQQQQHGAAAAAWPPAPPPPHHQQQPALLPPHLAHGLQQHAQQSMGASLLSQLHGGGSGGGGGGGSGGDGSGLLDRLQQRQQPQWQQHPQHPQPQPQQQQFGGGLGPLPPMPGAGSFGDGMGPPPLPGLQHGFQQQQQQYFDTPPPKAGPPPGFGPPLGGLTPPPSSQQQQSMGTPGQGASLLQQLQARGALYAHDETPPPPQQQQQPADARAAMQHAADSLLQQLHHHPPLQPGVQQQAAQQQIHQLHQLQAQLQQLQQQQQHQAPPDPQALLSQLQSLKLQQQQQQQQQPQQQQQQQQTPTPSGPARTPNQQEQPERPPSPPPIRVGPPGRTRHPAPPHLPPLRSSLRTLDGELAELAASLAPPPEEVERHRSAYDGVKNLLRSRFPACGVVVFGSAANALGIRDNNDIDVSLSLEGLEDTREAKGEFVEELEELFSENPDLCSEVFAIPRARIPVIKFVWKPTGTKVDITLNNDLAVANTALLRVYAAIDPRLRQLVLLIKHWAKRRRVNDAYTGTLSSYAYCLMAIAHLQQRAPPVLPILQEGSPTRVQTIGKWNCDYFDDVAALQGWGAQNKEGLSELLASFFFHWAVVHDYRNAVLTIRRGAPMTKSDKGWTMRIGTERHLVCIEDPFETSHDLGRTVGPGGADRLKGELRRAWRVVRESPTVVADLFARAPEEDRALWDSATPDRDRRGGGGGGGRGTPGQFGRGGGTPRGRGRW